MLARGSLQDQSDFKLTEKREVTYLFLGGRVSTKTFKARSHTDNHWWFSPYFGITAELEIFKKYKEKVQIKGDNSIFTPTMMQLLKRYLNMQRRMSQTVNSNHYVHKTHQTKHQSFSRLRRAWRTQLCIDMHREGKKYYKNKENREKDPPSDYRNNPRVTHTDHFILISDCCIICHDVIISKKEIAQE